MTRSRSVLALACCAMLLLGACSRNREATQGSVKDDVHEQMLDPGYVSAHGEDPIPLEDPAAEAVATCVSESLFDPEQFTKDEREAAANSFDADEPDPDLVVKVEDLVNRCYDEAVTQGPSTSDAESTTTTEG